MLDCIQMLFSQTYVSVTFLMMYATMWLLNIRFDPQFFAIGSCLLTYMRTTTVEYFGYAVRDLVHYISAQRRIQVCLRNIVYIGCSIIFTIGISPT